MTVLARLMPCLLLKGAGLVKTVRFDHPVYLGDPRNILKIFNEKEVDELILLDTEASAHGKGPAFDLLSELAEECFMPLCYGGGLCSLDQIEKALKLGVEKISLNAAAVEDPPLVARAAKAFGSQSIVASMDAERVAPGLYEVLIRGGKVRTGRDPVSHAKQMEDAGAGEILLTSVDRDGTLKGYDLELIHSVASAVGIPVIACGGAGHMADFNAAMTEGGAAACAAGSVFVFYGPHRAVLISFPKPEDVKGIMP